MVEFGGDNKKLTEGNRCAALKVKLVSLPLSLFKSVVFLSSLLDSDIYSFLVSCIEIKQKHINKCHHVLATVKRFKSWRFERMERNGMVWYGMVWYEMESNGKKWNANNEGASARDVNF